ncbi:MAG: MFS transporter [Eubacteriales bacterium]|nr:MFS transporter [Clostridiales bacterium]MDY3822052.1 MFS transporter [Eubacteriales bacterium]
MDEKQTNWKSQAMLFLISQCITLFGSTLVQMAIVWYVTIQTSSGVWVAAFTVCSYLPQFLISFVAGVWADRHSRKKLIIGADSLIALVTFLMVLAIPHITDKTVVLGGLLVMSVIRSFGAGIQTPAVNAVIPQLVPEDQIMRFNGINATMQSVVQFAAPAAAGVLLTINTLSSTLIIDTATAIVGIGLLSAVIIPKQAIQNKETSVFIDMKIGIKYTLSDKLIGKVLTVYGLFIFLCVPAGFLSQLFVSRVYGETYWYLSAVELAGFIGMVAGGILMSIWGGFKSRVTTMSVGLIAFGSLAIGMGLSKQFALYLTLMIIYGVAITMVQTATTTLIQEKAEMSMQGRVFGLLGAMYSGFLPVGMAIFGPMADEISLKWIMIGSGIALIALSIFVGANKEMRLSYHIKN